MAGAVAMPASDTFLKSKHWDPSQEGGGLESGTCGPEGRRLRRRTTGSEGGEQGSGGSGFNGEAHGLYT